MHWFIDGNNVIGAGGDGWWNDPLGAAERLAAMVAAWVNANEDPVTLVFDGAPEPRLAAKSGGLLVVEFASRRGRDAADDRIVELVGAAFGGEPDLTVVTSDKGLIARLPPGVAIEGAGAFRSRLGLGSGGRGRTRP